MRDPPNVSKPKTLTKVGLMAIFFYAKIKSADKKKLFHSKNVKKKKKKKTQRKHRNPL